MDLLSPTFHQVASPEVNPHSAAAIDFLPRTGAFTTFQIPILGSSQIIWPKVSVDYEGNLQTVHTESEGSSLDYYAKGVPEFDSDGFGLDIQWPVGFMEWEPGDIYYDGRRDFMAHKPRGCRLA